MTHLGKYRENEKLINNYINFLAEVSTKKDRLKIIKEIARLENQNEEILKMQREETIKDIDEYTIDIPALFNYTYYDNKITN